MFAITSEFEKIKNKEVFEAVLSAIESNVELDTITATIDEKNPGRYSYTSDGGSFSSTYRVVGALSDLEISIMSTLVSAQNYMDTIKHYTLAGFISIDQYRIRKEQMVAKTTAFINGYIIRYSDDGGDK